MVTPAGRDRGGLEANPDDPRGLLAHDAAATRRILGQPQPTGGRLNPGPGVAETLGGGNLPAPRAGDPLARRAHIVQRDAIVESRVQDVVRLVRTRGQVRLGRHQQLQGAGLVANTLLRESLDSAWVVGLEHEQQIDVAVRRHLAAGTGAVENDPPRSDGLDQRGRHPLENVRPRAAVGTGAGPLQRFWVGVWHIGMFA